MSPMSMYRRPPSGPESPRARGDRGASVVEFALVVPFFIAIIMGVIDFGLLFWAGAAARQGARETARSAAVADWGGDSSCTLVGVSPNASTRELMCFAKDAIGQGDTDTRINIRLTAGGDVVGEHVIVCAQIPGGSTTGFYAVLDSNPITARVVMRIEVDGDLIEAAETALDPSGWAACTV